MKKMRYLLLGMLLFSFSLCLFSCKEESNSLTADKNEKDTVVVNYTEATFTQAQLLKMADLVVKGTVVAKNSETMSNPDGSLKDPNGYQIVNQLITDYTVEIEEIYKGSYDGETIHVKTAYGDGLSPDLILYGEDENAVLGSALDKKQLTVNGDCILLLTLADSGHEESSGYFPTASLGYLIPDGSGRYTNGDAVSNVTVTPETLSAEIAAACAEE